MYIQSTTITINRVLKSTDGPTIGLLAQPQPYVLEGIYQRYCFNLGTLLCTYSVKADSKFTREGEKDAGS